MPGLTSHLPPSYVIDTSSPLHPENLIPVPRKSWPPAQGSFTHTVHSARQPIVLTDTFLASWPARTKWTSLLYLNKQFPGKLPVSRNRSRTFVHHDSSESFPMNEIYPETFERVVVTKKAFWEHIVEDRHNAINPLVWEKIQSQMTDDGKKVREERKKQDDSFPGTKKRLEAGHHYYFNTMLNDLNSPTLSADIPDTYKDLVVDDFAPAPDGTPAACPRPPNAISRGELKLWIGSQGNSANLHYDATHNFYLQIRGRKRFLLISPEMWDNIHCHPRLHPSDRQSLAEFLTAETDEGWAAMQKKLPRIKNVKGHVIEAILEEGQVLYIPPFWFHNVESLDAATVSINVWSSSREEDLTHLVLLANAAPFLNDPTTTIKWTPPIISMALQVYLAMLADRIEGVPANFFEDVVVEGQYGILGVKAEGPKRPIHPGVADRFKPMLEKHVERICREVFKPMQSDGIRRSVLAGYAEAISNHILQGRWRDVPGFLRNAQLTV